MKKISVKDFKKSKENLEKISKYLEKSKEYFKELDKVLNNIELSDSDKVIMINNQYKEFESSVLK